MFVFCHCYDYIIFQNFCCRAFVRSNDLLEVHKVNLFVKTIELSVFVMLLILITSGMLVWIAWN